MAFKKDQILSTLAVGTFSTMCIAMIMLSSVGMFCMTHHGRPTEGDFFKKCVLGVAEEMDLLTDKPGDSEHDRYFKGMIYLDIVRKCGGL